MDAWHRAARHDVVDRRVTAIKARPKLCPSCRAGDHDDRSHIACDCTHQEDPMATAVDCPHCPVQCAGPAGLASHVRSMHPEHARAGGREAPPGSPVTPASNGLVWEDPPAPRSQASSAIQAILLAAPQLRRNPGRWAKLRSFKSSSGASSSKNGASKRAELVDIELVARKMPGGSALFGRYIEAD